MSSLRPPGLGPIVGHTTPHTCRIWIRAGDPEDEGARVHPHRRTVGVIAVTRRAGQDVTDRRVHYFRLQREFDRTGLYTLGLDPAGTAEALYDTSWTMTPSGSLSLDPDVEYEARVGTLTIDDPDPDTESMDDGTLARRLPDPAVWFEELLGLGDEAVATFRTFPAPGTEPAGSLAFILGSCRYPGILWQAKHADAIFGPLLEEAAGRDGRSPTRFTLMVGDQIYADMLNRHIPIGLADSFREFQERYHTAFGSPRMRRLLRSVPTYMILDDHEIEDNWTQDRISSATSRHVFNHAIKAYMSYQWIHGPRTFGRRLYYQLECGGYPFFVLDTRTQRYVDDAPDSLEDNHLLGRESFDAERMSQLDALCEWLQSCPKKVPKFIVTSSVFAPNPMNAREGRKGTPEQRVRRMEASDSWPAFPATRRRILETIVSHEVQNVVFLSGDIHCSNVAKLSFSGSPEAEALEAYCITSSAFYWPFPFADGDPSNFVHDSTHPKQKDTFPFGDELEMNYEAWNFTQEDNFCRIDVDRGSHRIIVRPFDSDGALIRKETRPGTFGAELETELELVPW